MKSLPTRSGIGRAVPYLVPLAILAAVSGVVPVIAGLAHTISGDGLSILRILFSDKAMIYSVRVSVLYAVAGTLAVMGLALPIAITLYLRPKVFPLALVALAIPAIVPVFISGPVWRLFFHGIAGDSIWRTVTGIEVNLLTQPVASFLAVLFAGTWRNLPAAILILYSAAKKVPMSCIEAARIDGARQWETVRHIFLPQMRGIALILVVVSLVEGFGEFTLPFVMTAGGPPLISGMTNTYIVGATTTVEIFLYDIFQFSGDLRVPAVYASVTLVAFSALAGLWALVRRRSTAAEARGEQSGAGNGTDARAPIVVLTVLAVLIFDRTVPGFVIVGILVTGWLTVRFRRPVVAIASAAYVVYGVVLLASRGFLDGFQPGSILALLLIRPPAGWLRLPDPPRWLGESAWMVLRIVSGSLLTVSVLVFLYLLGWVSFSGVDSVFVDSFIPEYFGLANFRGLLSDPQFYRALLNTLMLAGMTAVLTVLAAFPAAAAIATRTRRGRSVFYGLQFLRLSGGIHSLIPLFAVFLLVGLVNTNVPLVMLYAFQAAPLAFAVFHGFIRDLPRSLYDHARTVGATGGQYFRRVLLPLCGPPAMTAGLLAFLAAWNGFLIPLVFLTDQHKFPLSIYLHNAVGSIASGTPAWGLFAAGSVLNLVVLAALFTLTRKPFLSTSAAQIE